MNVAYVRVSSVGQNEQSQIEALKKRYDIDKWFVEKKSGRTRESRVELQRMLDYVRDEKDTVHIFDFSRLARSLKDLLNIHAELEDKGVALISMTEGVDTSTAAGIMMMQVVGSTAEFINNLQREKQLYGISEAKRLNKYKKQSIVVDNIDEYYNRFMHRQQTKTSICKELGISKPTLDRLFREYEQTLKVVV